MKKILINVILIITFLIIYFLQSNLFSWFKIAGVMPNLFIILVLYIGLYTNKFMGVIYGIILGIFLDLFIGKRVGLTAIMLGIVGIIGVIFDKNFSKENRLTLIIMVLVSTIVYETGLYFLSYFIYDNYKQVIHLI